MRTIILCLLLLLISCSKEDTSITVKLTVQTIEPSIINVKNTFDGYTFEADVDSYGEWEYICNDMSFTTITTNSTECIATLIIRESFTTDTLDVKVYTIPKWDTQFIYYYKNN